MEVSVLDSIDQIALEWDDLATRAGASPFLRPGWFQAWWGAFGRGRLAIVSFRRDGALVGVAPFSRHWGTTLALANVHSPEFALLAEDVATEREIADHLFASSPLHTSLCYLQAGERSTEELYRAARAHGRRLFTVTMQRSPYVEIGGDWEQFEQGLAKKFVADLRRRRRALEREGAVSVEVADGSERIEELIAETFRIEPSGWKDKRGTAIRSGTSTSGFYEALAAWAAPRGFLRLAFLRVDGRPIAVHYALEADGSWYFLKGGLDPEWRRFAPGKLLVHSLIERGFSTGLRSFEFLGADEPWKNDWRPSHRELLLQHTFPRTAVGLGWGSVLAAWRLVGLPLAKRTLALVR